jgi:hypothetical protein
MAAALSRAENPAPPPLTPIENAFIRAVLEHQGIFADPGAGELAAAIAVLRRYEEQCRDNPGAGAWEPTLRDEESQAEVRAKVFVMFGVTKPTPLQWRKAYNALFGPLLCETCG